MDPSGSAPARSPAEAQFTSLRATSPSGQCLHLLRCVHPSNPSHLRAEAAISLRNILSRSSDLYVWPRLSTEARYLVKSHLLASLLEESPRSVVQHLRGIVIELGSSLLLDNSWPELPAFVFNAMVSASPGVQESGLLIFSNLAKYMGSTTIPSIATLDVILLSSLTDVSIALDLRIAVLLAAIRLMHRLPPKDLEELQDLLPTMMRVLVEAFARKQERCVEEAVKELLAFIRIEPTFFCQCWDEVVGSMLQMAEADKSDGRVRCRAVIFVVSLARAIRRESGITNTRFILCNDCVLHKLYERMIFPVI